MHRYKAVLFDMDGTLVDSKRFHEAVFKRFFKAKGICVQEDKIIVAIGKTILDVMIYMGIPEQDQRRLIDELGEFYINEIDDLIPTIGFVKNAIELITDLKKAGLKVALITNSKNELVDKIVRYYKQDGFFDAIRGADTDSLDKNERCRDVIKSFDVKPEEVIYVGDLEHDVILANDLGIDSCIIYNTMSWVYPKYELLEVYKPSYIIHEISEFADIILKSEGP